jgi:CHAT domain-containing protein
MVGLSWAFFVAGARSTMATQWRVSSPATADLMIGFYRILGDGRAAAMALRTAQRQLIRGTRYQHPFYWAAFVLFD